MNEIIENLRDRLRILVRKHAAKLGQKQIDRGGNEWVSQQSVWDASSKQLKKEIAEDTIAAPTSSLDWIDVLRSSVFQTVRSQTIKSFKVERKGGQAWLALPMDGQLADGHGNCASVKLLDQDALIDCQRVDHADTAKKVASTEWKDKHVWHPLIKGTKGGKRIIDVVDENGWFRLWDDDSDSSEERENAA